MLTKHSIKHQISTVASYLIGYQQVRTMLEQTGDAINLDIRLGHG